MEDKICVIFTKITKDEWKAFKLACVQAGKPMTEVLWGGAQMYLTTKPEWPWAHDDTPKKEGVKYHGNAVYIDPLDWAKEGRKE